MVKLLLVGIVAYFIAKHIIEPSPVGGVVSGVLSPIGAALSGITA